MTIRNENALLLNDSRISSFRYDIILITFHFISQKFVFTVQVVGYVEVILYVKISGKR